MGTVSGLQSERDLESDRYEYFYREANEQVVIRGDGSTNLERSPLPRLRPNEVLIQTDCVGVTTEFENGEYQDKDQIIPSGNYVGTVAEIGANANSVEVGDTVVGSTTFGCGLCHHCSEGNDRACEDPVKLGIDTETGAHAKFVPVPSNHVYQLPENATPKQGTLVRTLAKVSTELDKAGALVSDGSSGLVIGDTPIGRIATQIFDHEHEYDIDQTANREYLDDVSAYKLIVDTTGDPLTVERYLQRSKAGTVVLLLGTGYGDITLPDGCLNEITIINPGRSSFDELDRGIELLSIVEMESILDGTYSLEAYETAWQAAAERERMPVIEIDT
jgi:threonine dehydrogenase-like Zn-dependent dehydrogenase